MANKISKKEMRKVLITRIVCIALVALMVLGVAYYAFISF